MGRRAGGTLPGRAAGGPRTGWHNAAVAPRLLLHAFPVPGTVAPLARTAEDGGWDGLLLADSQNLVGDPYVELGLAAASTSRIELGTFVTNPVTRHPAATAAAIATVHAESAGRAVLGIGRGDSALASIGERRAGLAVLGDYVARVRRYLESGASPADGLRWLAGSTLPPVPVDVAATGPRTIELAATAADRVTFAVGASAERLRWALDVARAARARSGLDPASLRVGACVVAATAPRPEEARDLVRANVGIFARFNGQAAAAGGSPADGDRAVERTVAQRYDESRHGLGGAAQTGAVPDEYVDRLAVVGAPARCAERLEELASVGLDHLVVVGPSRDVNAGVAAAAVRRFAAQVLPRLR